MGCFTQKAILQILDTRGVALRDRPIAFIRASGFSRPDRVEINAAFEEIDFDVVSHCDDDIRLSTTVESIRYIALSVPLLAFVTAIAKNAGEDAYLGLKNFVKKYGPHTSRQNR